ncbi:MAG: iron-containing alcohol dehydrogenase [Oscillospiraceae bacterium]|nr:iron-containing alcohol dehydrogenase [Oscillospiraceae bacterium]
MNNFTFSSPTTIVFGRGVEGETGKQSRKYGTKALLVYGGGSIKTNGVYDKVVASLQEHGVEFWEFSGVQPNPTLSHVRKGIALCREIGADLVLAVGGGSVIDSAKAIAAGAVYEGDIWDFFKTDSIKLKQAVEAGDDVLVLKEALPVGVVLTIPAAGSEASTAMVITNDEGEANIKRGYNSEAVIPRFAVINPETNYTLPPYQTACGSADILAHLMERYFTNVTEVDITDRLIEGAMQTVLQYAPVAMENPEDYEARAQLNFAGWIAHNNLFSCGRIGDWGSHMIQQELSGLYDIAHGAGLSIVFPAWMKYVYKHNPERFVQFAVRLFHTNWAFEDKDRMILGAIESLERFFTDLGLPTRLSHAGIGEDKLREMAERAVLYTPTVGNFVKLDADDIYNIYRLAL